MDQLFDELKLLEDNLDKLELFNKIKLIVKDIKNNQELINLIDEYNLTKDEKLRDEIYSYQEIKKYKKYENEVNFLILEINSKLKDINTKRSCNNASN